MILKEKGSSSTHKNKIKKQKDKIKLKNNLFWVKENWVICHMFNFKIYET